MKLCFFSLFLFVRQVQLCKIIGCKLQRGNFWNVDVCGFSEICQETIIEHTAVQWHYRSSVFFSSVRTDLLDEPCSDGWTVSMQWTSPHGQSSLRAFYHHGHCLRSAILRSCFNIVTSKYQLLKYSDRPKFSPTLNWKHNSKREIVSRSHSLGQRPVGSPNVGIFSTGRPPSRYVMHDKISPVTSHANLGSPGPCPSPRNCPRTALGCSSRSEVDSLFIFPATIHSDCVCSRVCESGRVHVRSFDFALL